MSAICDDLLQKRLNLDAEVRRIENEIEQFKWDLRGEKDATKRAGIKHEIRKLQNRLKIKKDDVKDLTKKLKENKCPIKIIDDVRAAQPIFAKIYDATEQGKVLPKRIIVPVRIASLDESDELNVKQTLEGSAIIDTGATETILSRKIGKAIRAKLTGRKVVLFGLGGGALTGHEVHLHIHLLPNPYFENEEEGLIKATVIENLENWLDPPLLIGMDFMSYETRKTIKIDLVEGEEVKVLDEAKVKELCDLIKRSDPVYWASIAYKYERNKKRLYEIAKDEIIPLMKKYSYIYSVDKSSDKPITTIKCEFCETAIRNVVAIFKSPYEQLEVPLVTIHVICKHYKKKHARLEAEGKGHLFENKVAKYLEFFAKGKVLEYDDFKHYWNGLTVPELMEAFKLCEKHAKELLDVLIKAEEADTYEAVDKALKFANEMIKGYGVEAIQDERAWVSKYYMTIIALYVNRGDTYDTTIVYDTENEEFIVQSWGDWYEQWEIEFKKRED